TAGDRSRDPCRQVHVVEAAEHRVAGVGRRGAGGQAGDVTALLVDGDDGVGVGGADLRGQCRRLVVVDEVVGEQADPGQARFQPGAQPGGERGAPEPGQEDPQWGAHPFSAPATRPLVIRPCTMRKKTITGIATSVEPAMITAQSVSLVAWT